ncbi:MAG TPA: hypothetical protein VF270_04760, partial [Ignavibacteriaceae bacterium]
MNNLFRILTLIFFLTVQLTFAQTNSQNLWQDIDQSQIVPVGQRYIIPQSYRTVTLDIEGMRNFLTDAPLEFSNESKSKSLVLSLPMPDGTMQKFSILESPVMASELAAKYPDIKTYTGKGIDDSYASVKLDLTMHGFHAMIFTAEGNIFIDPYSLGDIH